MFATIIKVIYVICTDCYFHDYMMRNKPQYRKEHRYGGPIHFSNLRNVLVFLDHLRKEMEGDRLSLLLLSPILEYLYGVAYCDP